MKLRDGNSLIRSCRESIIIGYLMVFCNFLSKNARSSFIVQIFTRYDEAETKLKSSILFSLFSRFFNRSASKLTIKNKISRPVEDSLFMHLYRNAVNCLLSANMKSVGIGVFFFGITTTSVYILQRYFLKLDASYTPLVIGITLMASAIPVIISRSTLCSAISESRIAGGLLFGAFGFIPMEIMKTPDQSNRRVLRGLIYPFFGLFLGALTYFINPLYIIAALAAFTAFLMVMYKPEFGCLALAVILPFSPTMGLAALIILTGISFTLKLIRGKRTIKFDLSDCFILFFAVLILFGGFVSADVSGSIKPALLRFLFILSYFLVVNLIKTSRLAKQMLSLFIFSMALTSLYGIYQNFFGAEDTTWIDAEMFSDISRRVVSTFENPNVFAQYLVLLMPIVFALLISRKNFFSKASLFLIFCASGAALIYTWSRGAWLGFVIAMLIYFLLAFKNTILIYIIGLLSLPFISMVLPSSIISRFQSIGNLKDTSTSYRVSIWKAVVNMISDYFTSGIGVGEGAFSKVYPKYSLAGIEAAPHSHNVYLQITTEIGLIGLIVFILAIYFILKQTLSYCRDAASSSDTAMRSLYPAVVGTVSGILGFLAVGLTDYIFYNYRVFLIFFVLCGFAVACAKSAKRERTEINNY
ncbi:MAG: O-antigen ligase family protein [Oscillospiraceae bacterium]|nr:O-antigen ligase family protein [Oscillospiraceae bacterium]